jgi:hypothetical protein
VAKEEDLEFKRAASAMRDILKKTLESPCACTNGHCSSDYKPHLFRLAQEILSRSLVSVSQEENQEMEKIFLNIGFIGLSIALGSPKQAVDTWLSSSLELIKNFYNRDREEE